MAPEVRRPRPLPRPPLFLRQRFSSPLFPFPSFAPPIFSPDSFGVVLEPPPRELFPVRSANTLPTSLGHHGANGVCFDIPLSPPPQQTRVPLRFRPSPLPLVLVLNARFSSAHCTRLIPTEKVKCAGASFGGSASCLDTAPFPERVPLSST